MLGRGGPCGHRSDARLTGVSVGEELLGGRRRRRRADHPRLSEADRQFLDRLVDGDLAGDFQAALNAVSGGDPLVGGGPEAPD